MRNFDTLAQQVWNSSNIETKRQVLSLMIDQFQYKSKANKFRAQAVTANATKLDQLAANIMLNDTDKVIK